MIRVGRCRYGPYGNQIYPKFDGFEQIVVIMKSHSKYNSLSPFYLKDDEGRIMENVYQMQKLYKEVPQISVPYSRHDKTVIWSHPAETHVNNRGEILPAYWAWREKGMNNEYAVRYPVGYKNRSKCLYAIPEYDHTKKLDYVSSRIKIYIPLYCELAKADEISYPKLRRMLAVGKNLLIIEPDGPHQESLDYYKRTYNVEDDFIVDHTMLANAENLSIMVVDTKHPFGHGYCLAMSLLGIDESLVDAWSDILDD